MKKIANTRKTYKSRRTFLKSAGMLLAGLSIMRSSIFGAVRNSGKVKQAALSDLLQNADMQTDGILPEGVRAVWDISRAWHETTPNRERICINGLWQWQPGSLQSDQPLSTSWGYFKVPGNWPGLSNYMQRENQRVYPNPAWEGKPIDNLVVSWYRREITIPVDWTNRRIILSADYVNSSALVFIDDKKAGEILFPAGELDLTSLCSPGKTYTITIKVTAMPLQDVVAVFNDSNASRQGKGVVARKGLCGDVYLSGIPQKARISDVRVLTSFRKEEITFRISLEDLTPDANYRLHFTIEDKDNVVTDFSSSLFRAGDLKNGSITFSEHWKPDNLWDIHTPENMFDLTVSLLEKNIELIDTTIPTRFGFREFWIDGRDFYLNGNRIFLSTVPLDNAQSGAALANYDGARESFRRLKSFGINFVYTHNYGCEPGTHISFAEILDAADDEGMLISLSQPHFGQYDWTATDADQKNSYAHHARFYTKVAGNHPSVVFYSMSHNSTGYTDDMNPDMIDGLTRPAGQWSENNAKKALRAEAIVAAIDPGRIVYHHSSGNLSSMHTSNFYPNWVPIQEMNDWFEHWATVGVKPLLLCEYGAPFTWDWAIYRGWYKGKREFGSAQVPWEFCLAEWNSQFLGDKAFNISELEKANLRWEAERFRTGAVWGRSNYPFNFDSRLLEERNPVFAMHLSNHWRAFRTWGLSSNSPWHHGPYWKMKDGVKDSRKDFIIDWDNLQRPGLSPDFINDRANRMDLDIGFPQSDWIPNLAGEALLQNNKPLLAYIAGKPAAFTSKDHNFLPGSKLEKQLIIINNSRKHISADCSWSMNLPETIYGNRMVQLETGWQERIPLSFDLPKTLSPGNYEIMITVKFSNGDIQKDIFSIHVLPSHTTAKSAVNTALFDPKGETRRQLDGMGFQYQVINAGSDLSGFGVLIVGKEAVTADNQVPDLRKVRNGLKVIMFEQKSEVLEKRFGFRVQEYGLRKVFKRISDHPVMAGLVDENLCDWHGAATLVSPRLKYEVDPDLFNGVPTIKWCDIPVTRIWRCGNRGNVATVLIEKPACGNFLPLIDGGYSLHYSPLMEYREGEGMILFCQMDVTMRTEKDPAAERLLSNMLSYASAWQPTGLRQAVYAGDTAGKNHLEKTGLSFIPYKNKKLSSLQVLIIGPGGSRQLLSSNKAIGKWIRTGGQIIAIGLDKDELITLLPFNITLKKEEYIASYFEPFSTGSPFAGICPSDVYNRAPKIIPLVSEGADISGNGVLARAEKYNVIFCQLVPWQLDYSNGQHNVKQTYRRTSFMLNRLLGNIGVPSSVHFLDRITTPLVAGKAEKRWLDGLYVDVPEEWDDPYRFFRW